MMKDENHDEKLDKLMNDVVSNLVDGQPRYAGQALVELAGYFAKAGLKIQSFYDMRKHLIDCATEQVGCPVFIQEQLHQVEQMLHAERTGSKIIIIH